MFQQHQEVPKKYQATLCWTLKTQLESACPKDFPVKIEEADLKEQCKDLQFLALKITFPAALVLLAQVSAGEFK